MTIRRSNWKFGLLLSSIVLFPLAAFWIEKQFSCCSGLSNIVALVVTAVAILLQFRELNISRRSAEEEWRQRMAPALELLISREGQHPSGKVSLRLISHTPALVEARISLFSVVPIRGDERGFGAGPPYDGQTVFALQPSSDTALPEVDWNSLMGTPHDATDADKAWFMDNWFRQSVLTLRVIANIRARTPSLDSEWRDLRQQLWKCDAPPRIWTKLPV